MPSPFPGMDPFLEGQKWRDFHTSTLYVTRRLLTALLKPRYTVAIEPVVYTVPKLRRTRQRHLAIYSVDTRRLVTVMEVLSPTNKSSGYHDYLAKRDEIFAGAVHLVELDLLRRGRRLPAVEQLHAADYYAFVSRSPQLPKVEVYGWTLRERLPSIPIPLKSGDPDIVLDLQAVLSAVYEESGYDASLDCEQAVVPALTPADAKWVQQTLAAWRAVRK